MAESGFGSIAHFKRWWGRLVLDNGKRGVLEPFQEAFVRDLLSGFREAWLVVPEENGKTTLMAGVGLYHGDHVESAFVPIAASSREQAETLYRQAEGLVLRSDSIRHRFKCQEGYRRIKCLETGGRIQVFAADDRTADGVIPTLALVDELHRHKNLKLYRTWTGKLGKRDGQIAVISTAGEPGSEFEDVRAAMLRDARDRKEVGQFVRAVDGQFCLHDWAVRDPQTIEDMAAVALANPLRKVTKGSLTRKRNSKSMTAEHWRRFVCNIATRMEGQAVQPDQWDRLSEELLEPDRSSPVLGWLDLGWRIDTTAVGVLVWESNERRVVPKPRVIEPPVDEADVVGAILDFQEEFLPEAFVYDPNAGGQQMVQMLEKGEHPLQVERGMGPLEFVSHSQDNAPMALAAVRLDEAIRLGWLVHDGDDTLRRHVLNAVQKSLGGEKWKYDRPPDARGRRRQQFPIDALTGVLMGHSVACAQFAASDEMLVEVFG